MTACRREADVLRAAREDRWEDGLRRHLAECGDCALAASIAPWMTSFARLGDREHRLPDPSIVWLKAKLLQGNADAARAARPLTIIQLVSYLVVAGGWAAVLMWKWDAIEKWLHGLTPAGVIGNSGSLSLSFFALLFVLASMTVMLALHTILAEDV
jgi:hypothetical protein